MTASSSLIAPHLHAFFTTYLGQHKRASPQTVASCRDTFRLLLLGIVSKPVQKLVGKLTLFQDISQVLRHHKTT